MGSVLISILGWRNTNSLNEKARSFAKDSFNYLLVLAPKFPMATCQLDVSQAEVRGDS
jgi:hypothetical protein